MEEKGNADLRYEELRESVEDLEATMEENNERIVDMAEHIALLTEAIAENTKSNHGVEIMLENLISTIKNYSLNR